MTARSDATVGSSPDQAGQPDRAKRALRRTLLAARADRSPEARAETTTALVGHLLPLAATVSGPIACYLPLGSEPGVPCPGTPSLPDALLAAGHEVLVPVVPHETGPLDWARYTGPGDLLPGPLGTRRPTGGRRGVSAIASARLVLVPALAVDRTGRRIGRGGGYYDRTLPLVTPGTALVVPLHDGELLDVVPADAHDVPVGAVALPHDGVVHVSP